MLRDKKTWNDESRLPTRPDPLIPAILLTRPVGRPDPWPTLSYRILPYYHMLRVSWSWCKGRIHGLMEGPWPPLKMLTSPFGIVHCDWFIWFSGGARVFGARGKRLCCRRRRIYQISCRITVFFRISNMVCEPTLGVRASSLPSPSLSPSYFPALLLQSLKSSLLKFS